MHDDPQARAALHTRAELVEQLLAAVRAEHPDDVPCFIVLPILNGNPDYLRWVHEETDPPHTGRAALTATDG